MARGRGRPLSTAAETAQNKRTKTVDRTPQNPFEAAESRDTLETYAVSHIKATRWVKGVRQFLVVWEGYAEKDATWEPMEHLVGCAAQIREYEQQRDAEENAAKEAALEKRRMAREEAEAIAKELKEAAAAAALDSGEVEKKPEALHHHRNKTHALWQYFDLTVEKPSCKLLRSGTTGVCGIAPSASAGTTNYWAHLWTHHRDIWYELKRNEGKLNAAGEKEIENLKAMLRKASFNKGQDHSTGGHHMKALLTGREKEIADRVVTDWIVDSDQPFNAACTIGFKRMMSTLTNDMYDGCCDKAVKAHITAITPGPLKIAVLDMFTCIFSPFPFC
ncbi:hypothetical protein AB1Y20_001045 [Prymnesium parvum]|uniref:Chromo domain-containing protein n=1 Tax=Prymnesium parvum TaxID=97485 RepID=A0AB34K9Y5_PRYPA